VGFGFGGLGFRGSDFGFEIDGLWFAETSSSVLFQKTNLFPNSLFRPSSPNPTKLATSRLQWYRSKLKFLKQIRHETIEQHRDRGTKPRLKF